MASRSEVQLTTQPVTRPRNGDRRGGRALSRRPADGKFAAERGAVGPRWASTGTCCSVWAPPAPGGPCAVPAQRKRVSLDGDAHSSVLDCHGLRAVRPSVWHPEPYCSLRPGPGGHGARSAGPEGGLQSPGETCGDVSGGRSPEREAQRQTPPGSPQTVFEEHREGAPETTTQG